MTERASKEGGPSTSSHEEKKEDKTFVPPAPETAPLHPVLEPLCIILERRSESKKWCKKLCSQSLWVLQLLLRVLLHASAECQSGALWILSSIKSELQSNRRIPIRSLRKRNNRTKILSPRIGSVLSGKIVRDRLNFVAEYAKKNYSHFELLNPKDSTSLDFKNARFFVIKSYTEDDVHKSMKYQVWSSTTEGNKRLNEAYRKCVEENIPLLLFFSVNASGQFVGLCKMCSEVSFEEKLGHWSQFEKWPGKFKVEWLYIKDIPNKQFKSIFVPTNDYKPVTNSRDAQEIPLQEGLKVLKIFQTYKHEASLLDEFEAYDTEELKKKEPKSSESFGKFVQDPSKRGRGRTRGRRGQNHLQPPTVTPAVAVEPLPNGKSSHVPVPAPATNPTTNA